LLIVLPIVVWLFSSFSWAAPAKPKNPNQAVKAVIVAEQAYIFKTPSFDGEVIVILGPSTKVYSVSKGKWGTFHKIRLEDKQTGYVLDSDIRFVTNDEIKQFEKHKTKFENSKKKKESQKKDTSGRSIEGRRYVGPAVQVTNFTEDTMGSLRSQTITSFGARWSGPSYFMEGSYTETNILLYWGAPGYYADATGNAASGFILLMDWIVEMTQLQSKDTMTMFGIGPVLRASKIDATLTQGSTNTEYSLTDITLGAVFDLGIGTRFNQYALRFDGKYYWEKQKYWAFGLAFQWEF
jgi:hypothetical protein